MNKINIFPAKRTRYFVKNAENAEKKINFAKSLEKTFIIYYNIEEKLYQKQRILNNRRQNYSKMKKNEEIFRTFKGRGKKRVSVAPRKIRSIQEGGSLSRPLERKAQRRAAGR